MSDLLRDLSSTRKSCRASVVAAVFAASTLLSLPRPVFAQAAPAAESSEEEESYEEESEEPRLRAPSVELPAMEEEEEEAEAATAEEQTLPSNQPANAPSSPASVSGSAPEYMEWTRPHSTFELHGYLRFRGEFQDQFFLGRGDNDPFAQDLPFSLFRPSEDTVTPDGGCAGARGSASSACDQNALAFASMRLRLEPTIHLSDDVRIHMQVDVFDNMVLGSTPDGLSVGPVYNDNGLTDVYGRYPRDGYASEFVPITAFSGGQNPPSYGQNSLQDSIRARRAWAEVRNRGLGELRFGRMGSHWGLGMVMNDGRGLDADFQSDVDRVMVLTRLAGFYFFGAWDFASEGYVNFDNANYGRVAYDRSRLDDVDQLVFGAMRRADAAEQAETLARGDAVLNGGLYFLYRSQNLTTESTPNPFRSDQRPVYVRRGAEMFLPDLWLQFLWGKLRIEAEAAMVLGTVDRAVLNQADSKLNLLQFGLTLEAEYHLLNDQLGIYFNAGYASGDRDAEGLLPGQAFTQQPTPNGTDRTASNFSFHPNYRVDLIFWRTIMRQVSGAYYFRPGLSYDFIRSNFGQLLGVRGDAIWSRASESIQTWGNQADLGLEFDVSAYYRSEDGPELTDGFYAAVQGGIFFPFGGLGYLPGTFASGTTAPGGQNAWTLRLLLGVQY